MKLRSALPPLLFITCCAFFGTPSAVRALGPIDMAVPETASEAISGCVMFDDVVWAHRGAITGDTEIIELAQNNFDPAKWVKLGSVVELTKEQLDMCGSTVLVYYLSGQNGSFTILSYEVKQLGDVIGLLVEEVQDFQQSETTTAELDAKVIAIQDKIIADYGDTCCCRYTGGDPAAPATWLNEPKNEWACKNYSSFWTYQPLHCYGDPALAAAPASYTFSEKCASLHGY